MPALINRRRIVLAAVGGLLARPSRANAPERLPDGETTRLGAMSAFLIDPTRRYRHAVLGDDIEASGFAVVKGGRMLTYRLGPDAVFEDRRVRLADIDGDGRIEALVVKSRLTRGASLALYRIGVDAIDSLAESAPIGRANRWLNPVGVADFIGEGTPQIAAVVMPHLAGSLRLYRRAGARLVEVTRIEGYTNHIIGQRDLDLGRIVAVSGNARPPLIVLPTLDRTSLAGLTFAGGRTGIAFLERMPARIVAVAAPGPTGISVRLEDGTTRAVPVRP